MSHTKPSIKKDYRSLRNAKTVTMLFRHVFLTVADMRLPTSGGKQSLEKRLIFGARGSGWKINKRRNVCARHIACRCKNAVVTAFAATLNAFRDLTIMRPAIFRYTIASV